MLSVVARNLVGLRELRVFRNSAVLSSLPEGSVNVIEEARDKDSGWSAKTTRDVLIWPFGGYLLFFRLLKAFPGLGGIFRCFILLLGACEELVWTPETAWRLVS